MRSDRPSPSRLETRRLSAGPAAENRRRGAKLPSRFPMRMEISWERFSTARSAFRSASKSPAAAHCVGRFEVGGIPSHFEARRRREAPVASTTKHDHLTPGRRGRGRRRSRADRTDGRAVHARVPVADRDRQIKVMITVETAHRQGRGMPAGLVLRLAAEPSCPVSTQHDDLIGRRGRQREIGAPVPVEITDHENVGHPGDVVAQAAGFGGPRTEGPVTVPKEQGDGPWVSASDREIGPAIAVESPDDERARSFAHTIDERGPEGAAPVAEEYRQIVRGSSQPRCPSCHPRSRPQSGESRRSKTGFGNIDMAFDERCTGDAAAGRIVELWMVRTKRSKRTIGSTGATVPSPRVTCGARGQTMLHGGRAEDRAASLADTAPDQG